MIINIEQRHWANGGRRSLHDCAVGLAITEAIGPQAEMKIVPSTGVFIDDKLVATIGSALIEAIQQWDQTGAIPSRAYYVELWPEPLNVEPTIELRHGPPYPEQLGIPVDWQAYKHTSIKA